MMVMSVLSLAVVGVLFNWSSALPPAPQHLPSATTDVYKSLREKKSSRIIEDCYLVGLDEGTYYYKSKGTSDVCAVYLAAAPDQRVELTLDYLNVNCDVGGIVSYVDGWEMKGEVFPGMNDVPFDDRSEDFCGKVKRKTIISTSNVASLLYRVPKQGDAFKITVRFAKHPTPCHILVDGTAGVFTLRNHGRRNNCTLATIFPATISLVQMSVGVIGGMRGRNGAVETGVIHGCTKRGMRDYVLLGGGMGLDPINMQVEGSVCGMESNPRIKPSIVLCEVALVRLVSSGDMENSITVSVNHLTDLESMPTTLCEIPM